MPLSGFYVKEAYLVLPYIDYIGSIKLGIITPPMGLDLITSSRDIAFMEPAAISSRWVRGIWGELRLGTRCSMSAQRGRWGCSAPAPIPANTGTPPRTMGTSWAG